VCSKTAILSLVWQLIRLLLFSKITFQHCPGLRCLLLPGETVDNPPITDELLMRWMRHHVLKANVGMKETSFAELKVVDYFVCFLSITHKILLL
jgi:hypothetical protein